MTSRALFEFLRRWRVLLQVVFMVVVTAGYVWLDVHDNFALGDFEHRMYDWRLLARPDRPPPDDILILGIDKSCFPSTPWEAADLQRSPDLAYLSNDWPWNRQLWAHLTQHLIDAGARVVGYDILFSQPTPNDEECGKVFAHFADRVVITSELANNGQIFGETNSIIDPADPLIPDAGPDIVGLANFPPDRDGTVRSIQHGFNQLLLADPTLANNPKNADALKPDLFTFSWLVAEKVLGHPPERDPAEPMLINFYHNAEPKKPSITTMLLDGALENWDILASKGTFKGKVVFIGPLWEAHFKDNHNTPMGSLPGVEVQATAFANLYHGDWLRPTPSWVAPTLAIIFGLLSLLVNLRVQSVVGKIGLLLGMGVAFLVGTQWLFTAYLLSVPVMGATLGIVVCGSFGTMYDFMLERYERRRMLGVFGAMVSPEVANLVLSNRDDFEKRLGGERRQVVVLFSDIRSFTTWSEKVGPDALVTQLNEYFYGMVEVIQQEGGTVQKYIGDALMAAWGDVREQPLEECAAQSVRAAFGMMESLKKLNAGWVGQPKREQLNFGIGINLDEALIGRIGHPRRQEFTVMGDAVNLAARLESATKQYHQTILVGQNIYDLTKDQFDYRLADKMQVKGKTFAVPVYAPLGIKASPPPPGLAEYNDAIEKYYARDFAGAAESFRASHEKFGGDDFLCENYLERCQYYRAEPPPADWDGGWVLKDK